MHEEELLIKICGVLTPQELANVSQKGKVTFLSKDKKETKHKMAKGISSSMKSGKCKKENVSTRIK